MVAGRGETGNRETTSRPLVRGAEPAAERKGSMARDTCKHSWTMEDVRYGFIVVEKCYHCNEERSYFAAEHTPPKEEYREGEHFWDYMGSSQSVQFNLKCGKCGEVIRLGELLGLMTCSHCTPDCDLHRISRICESQRIWVYGALTFSPDEIATEEMPQKLATLSQYFNDRVRTEGKKILVLPGWLIKDIDVCRGTVLKDVGMYQVEAEPQEA